MFVDFNILNQLGSPSINSNTFANRPAAGQTGRLFVSTDTFEIYRDNGTTWDLIGGPGAGTITGTGTATQVAYFTGATAIGSSANLYWDNTNIRLGIGTSTPGARLDIHGTGTLQSNNSTGATNNNYLALQRAGSNIWRLGDTYNGGDNYFSVLNSNLSSNAFVIYANTSEIVTASQETYSSGDSIGLLARHNLTILDGYNITTAVLGGINSNININLQGSATIGATGRQGLEGNNVISFTGLGGTLTVTQGSTVRAYSSLSSVYAFNGVATGTITHLAGLRVCFPDNSGVGVNITNNYAILINDQTTGTGTVTYTNRWGIYQEGASDLNYFNGNLLIKSTTNTGEALQVTGTAKITSTLTANSLVKSGGTASQILAADGSVITAGTNITIAAGQISSTGGGISGSGTTNYLPKFTAATTLGDSLIYDNALNIGISTATPGSKLQVNGNLAIGYSVSTPAPTNGLIVAGQVGVGVSPAAGFIIDASASGDQSIRVSTTSTGVNANAAIRLNATTEGSWLLQTGNSGAGALRFYDSNAGADRMRIFSNGNIGINTNTAGSKLQVNGNCAIGYSASTAAPTNGLAVSGNFALNSTISGWTSPFNVIEGNTYCGYIGFQTNIAEMKIGINHFYDGSGTTGYRYKTTAAVSQINITSANGILFNYAASGTAGTNIASINTQYQFATSLLTFGDAVNIAFNTTTGTKIGTATSQKLAFWNATPIVQPTTAVAGAARVGGGGTTVTDTDTFGGYTIAQVVQALRNTGILA